jgi:type IX secretion system PorP/SprF family membrane protein
MDNIENPIERTYFLNSGVYLKKDDFIVEPSVLFRYQANTPFQLDFNTRVLYKNLVWLGASYRHQDAVVFMTGFYFDKFRLGYAYDLTLSEVKDYTSGSHEINLVYYIFTENSKISRASFVPMFN